MSGKNGAIKLVAGNSNPVLAEGIAAYLKLSLTKAVVRRFADMEIFVEIQENVRGADLFVIQSTSFPANDHLMELLIIIDALRRSSARRITAVVPYSDNPRRRRPRNDARSPCGTDPGIFRYSDRQSIRLAGDGTGYQGAV
jgi:ribose-phosphate pyrophosphokinase